uniref:Actin-binding LIM protein 1 n=2 Tax=Cacopsylla melanoneura TaxID=428564 RepID=A0A8D9B3D0_9HEMI
MVKAYCSCCKKKCSGEVLRVQDKYFHISCFQCSVCKSSLAQGGYFNKDGVYYCTRDYQSKYGTKCAQCGDYVEGDVVTALGNTYHQKCFTCGRCRQVFPSGDRVTYQGKEFFCTKCVQIPPTTIINNNNILKKESVAHSAAPISPVSNGSGHLNLSSSELCAGCHDELGEGQALIALDKQWHVHCFKCATCHTVLHGEYMGKDGVPYCEKDYQKEFGVKCAYCNRFIYGKVLQAGDNHHFHPTCAKCSKCGDLFGDGEEMFVQGGAIWHPKCGPGPLDASTPGGGLKNGDSGHHLNGHLTDDTTREFDRMSSSAASELQFAFRSRTPSFGSIYNPNSLGRNKYPPYSARAGSPGLLLREYGTTTPGGGGSHKSYNPEDISMIHIYSYLTEEPTKGYLRRPIDPYDKPPTSPHFHRPHSSHSHRASSRSSTRMSGSRSGMKALVESYRSETPRSKSPHMNNEEPINLAHFPAAKPPHNNEVPKIERDDFPAPPYPYSDPERRRRWSDSYKGVPVSDDEDEVDNVEKNGHGEPIQKLKKEEEELSKIASGIGKVFLKQVQDREKLQKWKQSHLDPRNASRTPSATKEPVYGLRYQSPVNASPSRNLDAPRPWEEDEFDRASSYRSSVGRSTGAIHSYNVVSSLRNVPKPGYTLAPHRSHTFSSAGATSQTAGDFSLGGLGDKTHSTNFSSGKSDVSNGSIYDLHHHHHHHHSHHNGGPGELPVSSTYAGSLGYAASYSNHIQRSLPNMSGPLSLEPPKIYPYHLLIITNYRLPPDVDRKNLERHLSDAEFETLFLCTRAEFYRMPQWRRNEIKKRARLF